MGMKKLLIYATHGTYGRDDDAYGAMLAANAALAKGLDVTLVLVEDGTAMAKAGQDTAGLGLPNNLDELADFSDLGGRLVVAGEHLEERGIGKEELIDGCELIPLAGVAGLLAEHDVTLTF
jgi:sulfur relay (sulfurtransferase) DsrF/TusC family protein